MEQQVDQNHASLYLKVKTLSGFKHKFLSKTGFPERKICLLKVKTFLGNDHMKNQTYSGSVIK